MSLEQKLGSASGQEVALAVYSALHGLQNNPLHTQLLACAVMFLSVCHARGVNPTELIKYAINFLAIESGESPQIRGLEAYLKNEFKSL